MSHLKTNQIGHFLSAVRFGYTRSPGFIGANKWLIGSQAYGHSGDEVAKRQIIGHELCPSSLPTGYANAGLYVSYFDDALERDKNGRYDDRDDALNMIMRQIPVGTYGASLEDFRLSVKGYRFGEMIRLGGIYSLGQASYWLRNNLGPRARFQE